MSLRINNNISALSAHRNLKNNDDRLTRTLEKLSSGLQVSRAAITLKQRYLWSRQRKPTWERSALC